MTIYNDDDPDESWGDPARDDDSHDQDPDPRDLAREGGAVKCVHCGKWMLDTAELCPRCHQSQTDATHPAPKPRWFVFTAVGCVILITLFWIGLGWQMRWWPW